MKHLFLSSKDSLDNYPNNTTSDFTIELKDKLTLDGTWECALREIKFAEEDLNEDCYIFTDICVDSYVLNNHLPVLRQISNSEKFVNPYYFQVNRKEIFSLRLYIRNQNLQLPSTLPESVHCVLSLRKRP